MNRRAFLSSGAALPFAVRALAQSPSTARWILLGTNGDGVYRASWNSVTGALGALELAAPTPAPTWLTMHPTLPVVYAANEADQAHSGVSVFALDTTTAALTQRQTLHGDSPCYLSVLPGADRLVAANYGAGTVDARHILPNGDLHEDDVWHGNNATHGPNPGRQTSSHPHCGVVTPDAKHMIVCDLGCDALDIFRLEHEGAPAFDKFATVKTKPGSGPRHIAFHANKKWMYVIHEMSCTLELYDWDGQTPTLREGSTIATTDREPKTGADGFTDGASEVAVIGNHLYAATRGQDLLSVFEIHHATGLLKRVQQLPCGGRIPRHFALSPDGHWLLVANQGYKDPATETVAVFRRGADGLLTMKKTYSAATPMFVQFL